MPDHPTLASVAADLESGATCARKLVEQCLAKIADPVRGMREYLDRYWELSRAASFQ